MKTLRPLVLAFLILSLVTAGLPVSDALAHWARRPHLHRKMKHRRVRHSRAWWRRHRAWIRHKRERAARRRDERARRLRMNSPNGNMSSSAASNLASKSRATAVALPGPRPPFDLAMPNTWTSASAGAVPGTMKFKINTPDGRAAGTATIAPVTLTNAEMAVASTRTKTLGGVPFVALRRTVIDQMVVEGGWVVNDMEREFQGRRIYIVIAQSGSGGVARQSWTFYFTEMNGRIYSLSTNAPVEFSAPLAADAEQIMASLRAGGAGAVAVKSPR